MPILVMEDDPATVRNVRAVAIAKEYREFHSIVAAPHRKADVSAVYGKRLKSIFFKRSGYCAEIGHGDAFGGYASLRTGSFS